VHRREHCPVPELVRGGRPPLPLPRNAWPGNGRPAAAWPLHGLQIVGAVPLPRLPPAISGLSLSSPVPCPWSFVPGHRQRTKDLGIEDVCSVSPLPPAASTSWESWA